MENSPSAWVIASAAIEEAVKPSFRRSMYSDNTEFGEICFESINFVEAS
jgi:hypothetical protein